MRLSRRANTIILWIISIGLLVGMIITFTPTMGLFGPSTNNEGATMLRVNGERITELDVAQARQNSLFNRVSEGEVAEDLELLLTDQLIRQELYDQAASRVRVTGREVRQELEEFRENAGVAGRRNDQAYLQLIGQSGFTDQTFRDYLEQQLRRAKYEESLLEGVEVSDAEVETFYLANRASYQSEERIRARVIVVDDAELAADVYQQAAGGADFAELASEYSLERADRGGALGAPQGSTEPQPVGRAALPQAVSEAAFALGGPGLLEPVESVGRHYLVQVEEYVPATVQPFDEVAEQVREDALAAKQAGVVQNHIDELVAQAEVEVVAAGELSVDDYVVARVGEEEIMASELARNMYLNPQIQQSLSPELAPLLIDFFKPSILETMIDRKLAYLGAQELDGAFVGSESQVAQQALAFVSRDADATEDAVTEYYEANTELYAEPARAIVTRVEFDDQERAESFRSVLLEGEELRAAAEEHSASVDELGTVFEGQLEEPLDMALFGTDAFEELPEDEREISDVLVIVGEESGENVLDDPSEAQDEGDAAEGGEAAGEGADDAETGDEDAQASAPESFVVLVAQRVPERVRALEEVREQVEQAVLSGERAELQEEWLAGLRERFEVVNVLEERRAEREAAAFDALIEEGGGDGDEQPGAAEGEAGSSAEGEEAASSEAGEAENAAGQAAPAGSAAPEGNEEPEQEPAQAE